MMKRGGVRAVGLAAAYLMCAGLIGCVSFGGRRAAAPEGFNETVSAERLTDPAARQEAYAALFPAQPTLMIVNAALRIDARWGPGSRKMLLNYAATDAATVRMRGFVRQLGRTLFDVVLADGKLTVVLDVEGRRAFQGAVDAERTPVRAAFGVEPGDLWKVVYIGQRIAQGEWESERGWWKTTKLTPAQEAADGLRWIVLDRKTGLPAEAEWERGEEIWTVRYPRWARYGEPGFLMPEQVVVRPELPGATLTLTLEEGGTYRFGAIESAQMFEPPRLAGLAVEPIERLEEALKGAPAGEPDEEGGRP
jgi:hypothetical protein